MRAPAGSGDAGTGRQILAEPAPPGLDDNVAEVSGAVHVDRASGEAPQTVAARVAGGTWP